MTILQAHRFPGQPPVTVWLSFVSLSVSQTVSLSGGRHLLHLAILCLAQSPGLQVAQGIKSSVARDSETQQVLRKSKTQVMGKKKCSFQQFSTVLGCKPSSATGLGWE